MNINKSKLESKKLSRIVAKGMIEKKAMDIVILDLQHIGQAVADFFVICSGNTVTQVDAITDSVEETVYKLAEENPWRKEGKENKEWILLDYVDVVVHIFRKDRREFYTLEDLWGDAKITHISSEEEL
ncbi:MAG: ribosome silencing factor [Microscillaceae bacterium]|nr:ribosome silencing factor [Microscillaceae bacterium]